MEFREVLGLREVIHTVPLKLTPGVLTASPPFVGYVNAATCQSEIIWLDCRKFPPEESFPVKLGAYMTLHTNICCERRDSLIITYDYFSGGLGMYAYNTESSEKIWNIKWHHDRKIFDDIENKVLGGITTDYQGHVFVCDMRNSCVRAYSTKDGSYLGAIIGKGQQGLGQPCLIGWNSNTFSLIVAHKKNQKNVLSVFQVGYN